VWLAYRGLVIITLTNSILIKPDIKLKFMLFKIYVLRVVGNNNVFKVV
jgi:hypothetical protein